MFNRAVQGLGVLAVAGALVAGGTAAATAQSRSDQGPLTYHLTKHSFVHGPSHFRPGLVKIKVAGASGHALQLVSSRHGGGRATLAADVRAFGQTGIAEKLEHDFRLLGGASTGSTLFLTLKPGRYFLADTASNSISADQIKVVRVGGRLSHAAGYHKSGTLRAIHEMSWAKSPKQIPAAGYLRFENDATDPHFVVLARLKPGKHLSDVKKLFMGQENEQDVLYSGPRSNFDNGVISPRRSETVSYDLRPGRYVLACFWPDEHGVPHAMMGMIRTIKLV